MSDKILGPCRRSTGTFRAYFDSQAEAVAYAADPRNVDYHEDVPVFCGRCGKFHLSHPTWLLDRPWETIASELRVN
jgi:hypothetical protein